MRKIIVIFIFKILTYPILLILKLNKGYLDLLSPIWSKNLESLIYIIRHNTKSENNNFRSHQNLINKSRLQNFEDLSFLFNSNYSNRGIVALDFDEAAHIFSTIRKNKFENLLEIGRFLGGSTLLITVAKNISSKFISVDLKIKSPAYADDKVIFEVIKKIDPVNVNLIISNSSNYIPPFNLDFVFIDGDHSYAGVKNDYLNIKKYLNNDAHLLFHDAVAPRNYTTIHQPVYDFMQELNNDKNLIHITDVGSIRHFIFKK